MIGVAFQISPFVLITTALYQTTVVSQQRMQSIPRRSGRHIHFGAIPGVLYSSVKTRTTYSRRRIQSICLKLVLRLRCAGAPHRPFRTTQVPGPHRPFQTTQAVPDHTGRSGPHRSQGHCKAARRAGLSAVERVLKTAPKGAVFCRFFTGTETYWVISVFNEMPIPTVAVEYQRRVRNLLQERTGIFCQRMESEAIDGDEDELRRNVLTEFTLDIYTSPRSSFPGKSFRKKGREL